MVPPSSQSEGNKSLQGAGNPEFSDGLPPDTGVQVPAGQKRVWPVYTTVITAVMAVVVYFSTPSGSGLRRFLFPPHPPDAPTFGAPPPAAMTQEPDGVRPAEEAVPRAPDSRQETAAPAKKKEHLPGGTPLENLGPAESEPPDKTAFVLLVNGKETVVVSGETLSMAPSDRLVIHDMKIEEKDRNNLKVNFIGFVGNPAMNDAEDRNYIISPSALLKRHSLDGKGGTYRIEATSADRPVAEMFIRIEDE